MITRWLVRGVAIVSIVVSPVVATIDGLRGWPSGGAYVLYGACAVVFIAVGWLITERRGSNVVGMVLVAFGALFACYLPADLYLHLPGRLPGSEYAAVFIGILDAPMFILIALVLILFPDGRLPSPRWRLVAPAGVIGIGLAVLGGLLEPGPIEPLPAYTSPFGIPGFPGRALLLGGYGIMLTMLVLAAIALVTRWRRGDPVQRTQIKWVAAATLVLLVTELANVATYRADNPNALTTIATTIGIALVPIAMGVAILRYRLYEIDRIISRTLSYALVTGILALVFVGAILLLQTLLTPITGGQTIAVAASTLAVLTLFQPLLVRVRGALDRRFDRARYDGERTALAFSERLRNETDLQTVTTDLARTADRTVAPKRLGVWLRARDAGR
jgi:hypothetical protein